MLYIPTLSQPKHPTSLIAAMNPSLFSSQILFHFFIFFTIFSNSLTFTSQTISYSHYCKSFAPEATSTKQIFTRYDLLGPVTSHYSGGENLLDQDPSSDGSMAFESRNVFKTNVVGTYKIKARLSFYSSIIQPLNGSRFSRKHHGPLAFRLDGFWSRTMRKLCMVGLARWFTKEGNRVKLYAVLKLKVARFITLNTSLVSGILESVASPSDPEYFGQISVLGFREVDLFNYKYALVSNEECNEIATETLHDSVTSMKSLDICAIFIQRFITYKLEYPSNCRNCSLFDQDNDFLPAFMSLYAIQCSREDKKLRFLVEFRDRRSIPYHQSFRPDISLIGEGTWNGTRDELCIVACRILNQSDPLGSARVGDCSFRLTLWFPAVRSIKKTHTTEGRIWITKMKDDAGSFRTVKFHSFDHSTENYGFKYEYTQMKKVSRICPKKKQAGGKYYLGHDGLDLLVKHKNMVSTGSASPIFMGNRLHNNYYSLGAADFSSPQVTVSPAATFSTTNTRSPVDISFEISFILNITSVSRNWNFISSLNISSTENGLVEISAEGVYDEETGHICMVGCRNIYTSGTRISQSKEASSFDCEILVKLQLPNFYGDSSLKGSIGSLCDRNDVLYFDDLDVFSPIYTETGAIGSIWSLDLEPIMVLLSDTLMCVSIGQQLFHMKKMKNKPDQIVSFISVLMMLILTLGHTVLVVLTFSNMRNEQNLPVGRYGLLEVNELIAQIAKIVILILQSRLLQMTWIAKTGHWWQEIRALMICLPMYMISGLAIVLANWTDNSFTVSSQRSVWGVLRSYAGLTLDGFLFPQLVLNMFQNSKGNALCDSFYIGTTFVRLLPHVYDLYLGTKYFSYQFDRLYIYANPRADLYSTSWDVVICCGGIVFAVIVWLQQHFGGLFMFPERYQK